MNIAGAISRLAKSDNMPALTVERDYALAHIAAGLASFGPDTGIILQGGTALRLCYFENYRYSADLDFTVVSGAIEDAYATIAAALAATGGALSGLRLTDEANPRIAYTGPLKKERKIKLDLSCGKAIAGPERNLLLPRWEDLPVGAALDVLSLNEIASEKMLCMVGRQLCRDMLDLWRLCDSERIDVDVVSGMYRVKAKQRGIDSGKLGERYPHLVGQYRKKWKDELDVYVGADALPEYEGVQRVVSRMLRSANLLGGRAAVTPQN